VTGASGFIGRRVTAELARRGLETHALVRTDRPMAGGVVSHACDLLDSSASASLLADLRPTHLVHIAWPVLAGNWARAGHEGNLRFVEASLSLLRQFAKAGGRHAVVAGSCTEYDWAFGRLSENSERRPATFYGRCKSSLGDLSMAYAREMSFGLAWARIFFVYGPGEPRERLVSGIAGKLLRGEKAPCSHGRQRRDFLFVDDVARAFADILVRNIEGAINVGSGAAIAVGDIVRAVADQVGRPELVDWGALPDVSESPLVEADPTRLRDVCGFEPRTTLEEGLDRTIASLDVRE
jgi:nucleoside-diphosphate-sugar epimerase